MSQLLIDLVAARYEHLPNSLIGNGHHIYEIGGRDLYLVIDRLMPYVLARILVDIVARNLAGRQMTPQNVRNAKAVVKDFVHNEAAAGRLRSFAEAWSWEIPDYIAGGDEPGPVGFSFSLKPFSHSKYDRVAELRFWDQVGREVGLAFNTAVEGRWG